LRFPKRALLDYILNLLFPCTCCVCHAPVPKRRWGGACPQCWSSLIPIEPPFCPKCGEPAPAIAGLCGLCLRAEHHFDYARSALLFTHTFREIIHHLKYADRVSLAKPLGDILKECLQQHEFQGTQIIPVPLHRSRERVRGYNQAELIASRLGLPLSTRLLRRRKNTPSQTGLTRNERKRNLAGAFEVKGKIRGKLIIVDDVYTTGSTMSEIAKTLKKAGAERVEVLTVARVANDLYRAVDRDNSEGVPITQ
jgi:ComF family protein